MLARERIGAIIARINRAAPAGRKPPLLVAVTKGRTEEELLFLYNFGIRDFGENRIKEALGKMETLPKDIRWHFIGHLQTNKAKYAVGKFALIHSVDSQKLLEKINSCAREIGIAQDVLLEVNVSKERTKFGFGLEEVGGVVQSSKAYEHARILGLMVIAPQGASKGELQGVFRKLKEKADSLNLRELSMGMSEDFDVAIAEGATIVRIGRALFP
jgi:PLP dependent protein